MVVVEAGYPRDEDGYVSASLPTVKSQPSVRSFLSPEYLVKFLEAMQTQVSRSITLRGCANRRIDADNSLHEHLRHFSQVGTSCTQETASRCLEESDLDLDVRSGANDSLME